MRGPNQPGVPCRAPPPRPEPRKEHGARSLCPLPARGEGPSETGLTPGRGKHSAGAERGLPGGVFRTSRRPGAPPALRAACGELLESGGVKAVSAGAGIRPVGTGAHGREELELWTPRPNSGPATETRGVTPHDSSLSLALVSSLVKQEEK